MNDPPLHFSFKVMNEKCTRGRAYIYKLDNLYILFLQTLNEEEELGGV